MIFLILQRTGWVVWATNTWAVGLARRCRRRFDPRSRSLILSFFNVYIAKVTLEGSFTHFLHWDEHRAGAWHRPPFRRLGFYTISRYELFRLFRYQSRNEGILSGHVRSMSEVVRRPLRTIGPQRRSIWSLRGHVSACLDLRQDGDFTASHKTPGLPHCTLHEIPTYQRFPEVS